jgi:PTS system nitrogen regulatory IIA component
MALLDVLGEQCVRVGLEGEDKEEVLEELVDALVRAGRLTDRQAALGALVERERLGTTGIGGGVAIPHGKHRSISELTAAVGTSPSGIEWEAADGEPVYLVFLVLAEADNPGPHVQLLADIARLLKTPGLRKRLTAAGSPDDVMRLIDEAS